MALNDKTPQLEDGYMKIATGDDKNDILMALIKQDLNATEYKICLAIIRKTWGYHRKKDYISLSQFAEYTDKTVAHICNSIGSLLKKNIIVKKTIVGKKSSYQFNKNFKKWGKPLKDTIIVKIPEKIEPTSQVYYKGPLKDTIEVLYSILKNNFKDNILSKDNIGISYGNSDINELISYLKEKLQLPILDETVKTNRRYCWLILKKFGDKDKIKLLIDATAQNEFWSTKITSFKTLYYKAVQIISSSRDQRSGVTKV